MQRLLSIKLVTQTPRNLHSIYSEAIISSPKTNPFPQFNSNPYSLSHYYATCSNSWRSHCKQLLSNAAALMRGQSKCLVNRGFGFFKPHFPRRSFYSGYPDPAKDGWRRRYINWRIWLSRKLTPHRVLWGIIITNAAIFMLWRFADTEFMRQNFMVSLDNFRNSRQYSMITSGFSQTDTGHLILNMVGLYFFGSNIGRMFGGDFLLSLYLAGAFVGSAFFLAHQKYLEKSAEKTQTWGIDHSKVSGLGASGAVNAVMLLDMFLFPTSIVYVQFFLPVPAILLGVFIIGNDVWRVVEGDTEISGAAHLGGAAVAVFAWLRIAKGMFI